MARSRLVTQGMTLAESFDLCSAVLVLAGLLWGGAALIVTERRLTRDRSLLRSIHLEAEQLPVKERSAYVEQRMQQVNGRPASWLDLLTMRQDSELLIVRYLRPTLSGPFALAAAGAAFAVVAAIMNAAT